VKYLALIHSDEAGWQTLSDEARGALIERYLAFSKEAREAGVMLGGDQLAPTAAATTVRVRDGQTLVTDGPYAEVKEALGGYYLFECDSIDEALDWAAKIPGAQHGAIEVRQVHVDEESSSEAVLARRSQEVAS
jgi:hypothetical protein